MSDLKALTQLFSIIFGLATSFEQEVSLNVFCQEWLMTNHELANQHSPYPLLILENTQRMIDDLHKKYNCSWSYGGYLEDRRRLLDGSYLNSSGNFIHLGVDFNLPAGIPVRASFAGQVVVVDNDNDLEGGWGPRVIVIPDHANNRNAIIYAHLEDISVAANQKIEVGNTIGFVGRPPGNGNWWPHLHLQSVALSFFLQLYNDNSIAGLDGYAHPSQLAELKTLYPNPLNYLEYLYETAAEK